MGKKESAGLLMYRRKGTGIEVFLVHPGGPLFKNKDEGSWGIPKGEIDEGEDPMATAMREFREETSLSPPDEVRALGSVRQKGGKVVHAWAFESKTGEEPTIRSNEFEMEWPPRSGITLSFPEIDRGEYFALPAARRKINPAQSSFLDRLESILEEEIH